MKKLMCTLALALSLCALSCKKDQKVELPKVDLNSELKVPEDLQHIAQYLSKANGIKIDDILYLKKDSVFVMEGDMLISLTRANEEMSTINSIEYSKLSSIEKPSKPASISQRRSQYLVNFSNTSTIRVFNNCSDPSWREATSAAIRNWNHPSVKAVSRIRMVEVTSGAYDCRVYQSGQSNGNISAAAPSPTSNGKPGNYVVINTYGDNYSLDRKSLVITHELGHVVGFKHTDDTSQPLIPYSPNIDYGSIMNDGFVSLNYRFLGFTNNDLWAMNNLYYRVPPSNTQIGGTASGLFGSNTGMYSISTTPLYDGNYSFRSYGPNAWFDLVQPWAGTGIKIASYSAGHYWYITADKKIWRTTNSDIPYQLPGEAIDIAANSSGELYIVSNTYQDSNGNKVMKWNGTGWDEYIPPTPSPIGRGAKRIALPAGPNAKPFIVTNSNDVYLHFDSNNQWNLIASNVLDIAACNSKNDISGLPIVYIIAGDHPTDGGYGIHRWTGKNWFTGSPGGGVKVAVDYDGSPWHINNVNDVYYNPNF